MRPPLALVVLALPLVFAGCTAPAVVPDAPALAEVEEGPAGSELSVSLDGFFGVNALYCGASGCDWLVSAGGETRYFPLETTGNASAVNLTATWTPSSPLMERLSLGIMTCIDPCESRSGVVNAVYVEGPSPLTLQLDAFPVEPGETLYVAMLSTEAQPAPVWLTTLQDFQVEGTLVHEG